MPMGKKYTQSLREKFSLSSNPTKALAVEEADAQLSVNPELLKACMALNGRHTNRAPMVGYLTTCTLPNKKEIYLCYHSTGC